MFLGKFGYWPFSESNWKKALWCQCQNSAESVISFWHKTNIYGQKCLLQNASCLILLLRHHPNFVHLMKTTNMGFCFGNMYVWRLGMFSQCVHTMFQTWVITVQCVSADSVRLLAKVEPLVPKVLPEISSFDFKQLDESQISGMMRFPGQGDYLASPICLCSSLEASSQSLNVATLEWNSI